MNTDQVEATLDDSRRRFLTRALALAAIGRWGSVSARADEASGPLMAYVGTFSSPLGEMPTVGADMSRETRR